ncbi:hypothetical protein BDD12DRAFT_557491 [Trichophaea hybrida]|nr:hypothetical protein BDD12DRAFT_557491 [Trichophaea hybrida]
MMIKRVPLFSLFFETYRARLGGSVSSRQFDRMDIDRYFAPGRKAGSIAAFLKNSFVHIRSVRSVPSRRKFRHANYEVPSSRNPPLWSSSNLLLVKWWWTESTREITIRRSAMVQHAFPCIFPPIGGPRKPPPELQTEKTRRDEVRELSELIGIQESEQRNWHQQPPSLSVCL